MTEISLATLKRTQQQLLASAEELRELQGVLITGDASVLERHSLVLEQVRELKERYTQERDALTTPIDGGRRLFTTQYDALKRFAENNKIDVKTVSHRIKIERDIVVECSFRNLRLSTLEGLEQLQTLRKLDLSSNWQLESLQSIPCKALEHLDATSCSLCGDLSALTEAIKLKFLSVYMNTSLRSRICNTKCVNHE